ncbi:hypothetical protein SVAN01_10665 [Stagonosporopsis vannaccii]|nr:hypothetical protein SVAN01_10665 [Stagonosporopsis vannaccii]
MKKAQKLPRTRKANLRPLLRTSAASELPISEGNTVASLASLPIYPLLSRSTRSLPYESPAPRRSHFLETQPQLPSQWYAKTPLPVAPPHRRAAPPTQTPLLTPPLQAQTPQQRQANMRFAKAQEKKMGKPEGPAIVKPRGPQKSPISKGWISMSPFTAHGRQGWMDEWLG